MSQILSPAELASAFAHPLRARIAFMLADSPEPVSPTEVAERLDEPLGNVSYHVNVLKEHGVIELRREKSVRGAVQHFYAIVDEPAVGRVLEALHT
jgi:DNA-binding transcriptional ArsR family regulator